MCKVEHTIKNGKMFKINKRLDRTTFTILIRYLTGQVYNGPVRTVTLFATSFHKQAILYRWRLPY